MKTTVPESTSARFANLSFLAAIAVVFMHSGGGGPVGSTSWWFSELTTQGVFRAAVPFFFLASGFFLAAHVCEEGWWKREVVKRVRTILVPFWVWNGLYFLMSLSKVVVGNVMAGRPPGTEVAGPLQTILILSGLNPSWPANGPLWFMRSLFVLMLISPLLLRLSRKWLGCCFCFALYFVFDWQDGWRMPLGKLGGGVFSWEGLLYFSIGMRLRELGWFERFVDRSFGRRAVLLGLLGIALVIVRALCCKCGIGGDVPFKIMAVPCLMAFFIFAMKLRKFPAWLLSLTFPLYCLHSFPLFVVRFSGVSLQGVGGHLVRWIFACVVSACLALICKRTMPGFYRLAFGGR